MKLQADMDNTFYAVGERTTLSLLDLTRMLVKKDGRPVGRIEVDAGIAKGKLYEVMRNSTHRFNSGGLHTILLVLLHLGYDLTISKKAQP